MADVQPTGMHPQEARDLAARLASSGLPVFPIGLSWNFKKNSVDKEPLSSDEFKRGHLDASTDPETVQRMFLKAQMKPRCHWGVGLYPGPAGFIVLDIDIKDGARGLESLAQIEAEHGPLPGRRVRTASGGLHIYLRIPEGVTPGQRKLWPGIDIRSDKGWVVAPGVHTPWGSWTAESGELADIPQGLLNHIIYSTSTPAPQLPTSAEPGDRHTTLVSLAGTLRNRGAHPKVILAALKAYNEEHCHPPKPESELVGIVEWVGTKETGPAPTAVDLDVRIVEELDRLRIRDAALRLFRAELQPPAAVPPILTLKERLANPQPDVEWRIEDWQPRGTRVMLAAQFKAGKTTLTGNLARCLVDNDWWLATAHVTPVTTGTVTIVDFEMSERQIDGWLKDQGIKNDDQIRIVPLRGRAGTFDIIDDTIRAQWSERLAGTEYLILDCLRPILDALGLDEHRDGGRFLTAFDALCTEANIQDALVVHHMGHLNERARGDSRFRDWPDVEWRLVREADDPASPRYISAYGRDVDVSECQLEHDGATRHIKIVGGNRANAAARRALQDVLSHLENQFEPVPKKQVESDVAEIADHKRASIRAGIAIGIADQKIVFSRGAHGAHLLQLASSPQLAKESPARSSQLASAYIAGEVDDTPQTNEPDDLSDQLATLIDHGLIDPEEDPY